MFAKKELSVYIERENVPEEYLTDSQVDLKKSVWLDDFYVVDQVYPFRQSFHRFHKIYLSLPQTVQIPKIITVTN